MNILAVDTSSKAASVAIYCNGMLMGECLYNHGKNHSVYIAPIIEEMLKASDLTINDIDYFACGIGPGSFTGVRIGVTMMKTFGMITGKPCVPVDSLHCLAYSECKSNDIVVAVEDARRNRVFACAVSNGETIIETNVFELDDLINRLGNYDNKNVLFVGGGTRIYGEELLSKGFVIDTNALISGRAIAKTAIVEIENGRAVRCDELLPKYLMKSQAEQMKK